MTQKRTEKVEVRLTPDEKRKFKAIAALKGKSMSEILLDRVHELIKRYDQP